MCPLENAQIIDRDICTELITGPDFVKLIAVPEIRFVQWFVVTGFGFLFVSKDSRFNHALFLTPLWNATPLPTSSKITIFLFIRHTNIHKKARNYLPVSWLKALASCPALWNRFSW